MTEKRLTSRRLGLPVYLIGFALIVIFGLFVVALLTFDPTSASTMNGAEVTEAAEVSSSAYVEVVDALLVNASAERGAGLVESYGCVACHRVGAQNGIAPAFVGVAERAAERRPPMPAVSYLYESILHPGAYVVESYPNSMVQNFASRITDADLGDILAYLLTPNAW